MSRADCVAAAMTCSRSPPEVEALGPVSLAIAHGNPHRPHRFLGTASARPGNARSGYRAMGRQQTLHAGGHLQHRFATDGAALFKGLGRYMQHMLLHLVGVGHHATFKIDRTASHPSDFVCDISTRAALGRSQGLAPTARIRPNAPASVASTSQKRCSPSSAFNLANSPSMSGCNCTSSSPRAVNRRRMTPAWAGRPT